MSLLIVAIAMVAIGGVILLAIRGRVPRSLPVVLAVLGLTLGAFSAGRPAAASAGCVTTTAPTTTPATSPDSGVATTTTTTTTTTTLAVTTSSVATSTTTPDAPPTTVGVTTFCGTLVPNDNGGDFSIDVLVVMAPGGTGTYATHAPATGTCGGRVQETGLMVDASIVEPKTFCATNAPGSTALAASGAGLWTPPFPANWYACIFQGDGGETSTTELTTTTEESTTTTEESTTTTSTTTTTDPPPASFTVGGIISGLAGLLILQNNAFDTVPALLNGPFTFPIPVLEGASYNVTVLVQPPTQTCSVSNGSGTMGAGNVINVTVDCVFNP